VQGHIAAYQVQCRQGLAQRTGVGGASKRFGIGDLHEIRLHLVGAPDLGWAQTAQDAWHIGFLARQYHIWGSHRGGDEIDADHVRLANLRRAGY
jgi:hypothetical protein